MSGLLISVIVPVYKVEKYLDKCVKSIVNQTYENLEIILIDDGSPDNCPAICDSWAQKDSRVKVIHKPNGGVSSARNAAPDIASGDYIGFVDSDDWIEPDMYEILIKNAEKYNAEISRCAGFFDYGDRSECFSETQSVTIFEGRELVKSIVSDSSYANLWTGIYKKALFDSVCFDSDIAIGEDWLMNYWLNKAANRKVVVKAHKYHYIQRESSALHRDDAIIYSDMIKVIDIFWNNEFSDNLFKSELSIIYSNFVSHYINYMISKNQKNDKFKAVQNDLRSKYKDLCGISRKRKLQLFIISYFPHLYTLIYKSIRFLKT